MPLLLMCFRFPNIVHSQEFAALLEWPLLWGRDGILFKHLSKLRNISLHREIGNTQKSIDHIAHIQVTNPLGILTVGFITLLRFRVFWMGQSYPAGFLKDSISITLILRESNIIHKKIRNYLEEKRCPITKCSFRSIFLKAGSLCAYSFFS